MLARSVSVALLNRLREGRVQLVDARGPRTFGPPDVPLAATVRAHDNRFVAALPRGSLALAESYADGAWDSDDLVSLVRIGARELPRLDRSARPGRPACCNAFTRVPRNTRAASAAISPRTTTWATRCSGSSSTRR